MLKAITFDFWNTLYKSPADTAVAEQRARDFQRVLLDQGLDYSLEILSESFRRAWKEIYTLQRVYGQDAGPRGQVKHILQMLGVNPTKHWDDLYQAYAGALLKQPPEINEGVREILESLRGHYRMAVICNTGATPGVYLRQLMRADQIRDHFDTLVFSDEVALAKPSPGIFRMALSQLECGQEHAMHVGDDPITDVIGAKKAGLKAVWLAPKADWPVPEADYHIKKLSELLNLL